jgi:hypothetical protein
MNSETEAAEMQAWLDIALKLKYIEDGLYHDFDNRYEEVIAQSECCFRPEGYGQGFALRSQRTHSFHGTHYRRRCLHMNEKEKSDLMAHRSSLFSIASCAHVGVYGARRRAIASDRGCSARGGSGMTLPSGQQRVLVRLRMEGARQALEDAHILFERGSQRGVTGMPIVCVDDM